MSGLSDKGVYVSKSTGRKLDRYASGKDHL